MNNIKYLFFALVSIFSLFLFGSSAFAQEYPEGIVGVDPNPTGEFLGASSVGHHSMGWDTFEAGWLIGHIVYSPLGGELGQIEDLMIDRTDGHIALVIISGVQGFGAGFVAAPFSALERTGESIFHLHFVDRYTSMAPTPYGDPYAYRLYGYRSIVGLSTIPSRIDPLWADSVYQFYGQTPYWTEGRTVPPDIMSYRAAGPSILQSLFLGKTARVLMGAAVQSNDGKAEARIIDLVIDSKDGRVVFLVLDRVPEKGDMQVAVPFGGMSMSGNAFVLNITGDRLAAAPSFNESADMGSREYAAGVYGFFGVQPYWTEEEMH